MEMRKYRKSNFSDSEDDDDDDEDRESASSRESESDSHGKSFEEPPHKKIKCKKFNYYSSSSEKMEKRKSPDKMAGSMASSEQKTPAKWPEKPTTEQEMS